jgi:hypothetical protein
MACQGNGMGATWERYGMCELAFNVSTQLEPRLVRKSKIFNIKTVLVK